MKLSKLFQLAIEALDEDAQQELSFIAYPRHETSYDELKQSAEALRAIAPALVELLRAENVFSIVRTSGSGEEHRNAQEKYLLAWDGLRAALKEAGVSCD